MRRLLRAQGFRVLFPPFATESSREASALAFLEYDNEFLSEGPRPVRRQKNEMERTIKQGDVGKKVHLEVVDSPVPQGSNDLLQFCTKVVPILNGLPFRIGTTFVQNCKRS